MVTTGPSPAPSPFRTFLDRDWSRWLEELPEVATIVGRRGQDDRWTDDSPTGIEARRRHLETAWEEIHRFRPAELSEEDRLDFDLYLDSLAVARAALPFGQDPCPLRFGSPRNLRMPISQVDGIHISAPDILMLQPRANVADYRILLRRFERLPAAIDQQVGLLEEGVRQGWTAPKVPLRELPHQLAELVKERPEDSAVFRPFVEFPPSVPVAERSALVEAARPIYTQGVVPALERLRSYVESTYLPRCRTTMGISAVPGGEEWYRLLVGFHTTSPLTPREIHEIGLAEVRRLNAEMEKVRHDAEFSGSLEEFKAWLRTDPRFFPTSTEGMMTAYRALAKRIDPELAHEFGRLPRLPYGIAPVPDYRAPSSPAAYYIGGTSTTGRAGCFYVNTYDLAARPTWEMEALTLHEAVPGHHLQIALAEELEALPDVRRFCGPTAYVEGWGLYAESLGKEIGLYVDPYARFGQLSMDAWRSARLVVDTGLHALGWTREQAIDFLRAATGKSDRDIEAEVDRYAIWPGQALAYKMGQLKLRELRTKAETRLGARFDPRPFHDRILAEGPLPLELLSQRFERWLESAAAAR